MAFPCNQFGAQEPVRSIIMFLKCSRFVLWDIILLPSCMLTYLFLTSKGTHEEILNFVESKFGAKDKFTWFEKGHVNGANTREVYSFLKEKLPSDDGTKDIR